MSVASQAQRHTPARRSASARPSASNDTATWVAASGVDQVGRAGEDLRQHGAAQMLPRVHHLGAGLVIA
jgi:hypothetical protein